MPSRTLTKAKDKFLTILFKLNDSHCYKLPTKDKSKSVSETLQSKQCRAVLEETLQSSEDMIY